MSQIADRLHRVTGTWRPRQTQPKHDSGRGPTGASATSGYHSGFPACHPEVIRVSPRLLSTTCAALILAGCAATRPAPTPAAIPVVTGVASCDAYLASYLACHRAAGIFPAEQLSAHYQAMHDSLLAAAHDPQAKPYLDARCRGLANQLQASLQGRSCDAPPAASPAAH